MLETVVEARVYRLFKFRDDVLERRGGALKVYEFSRQEFVALLRLLEFGDHLLAISYPRLLYLYLQPLDVAPAFLLHAPLFRKRTLRHFRPLPPVDGGPDERYPLPYLFFKTLT